MSFPPGTEMFQFPGFASPAYVFSWRYPIGVGCPIRISTDQRLLAAPRGFSQRATSFIASWCQGIHRMPLSCSRASLDCSSDLTMHRNHPQLRIAPCGASFSYTAHYRILPVPSGRKPEHNQQNLIRASEPSPSDYWGAHFITEAASPGQTRNRTTGCQTDLAVHPHHTRPETHQNLIHPDKEQNNAVASRRDAQRPRHALQTFIQDCHGGTETHTSLRYSLAVAPTGMETPTDMETIGIEPTTPCLQSRCSPS